MWSLVECAIYIADALLLYWLIMKYSPRKFAAADFLPIFLVALSGYLRVYFGLNRAVAPFVGIFVAWCFCLCCKIKPLKALIVAFLYFVFIEISEIFVMGVFSLAMGNSVDFYSNTPYFNLAGVLLSRIVFAGIINSRFIKLQSEAPVRYQSILTAAIVMITLCMEFICLTLAQQNAAERLMFTFISLVMFFIVLLVLVLFNRLTLYYAGYYENREIARSLLANQELYDTLAANDEQTNKTLHEYKNHIYIATELLKQNKTKEAESYLESISADFRPPFVRYLKNNIADIVINKKAELAKELGVDFSVSGFMGQVEIRQKDICSLISNLLDNAIEAAAKCENGYVRLRAKMMGEYLYVSTTNSISQMPKIVGESFITTKKDARTHGLGIKIIKDIVKRYNGEFDFNIENGTITISVLLKNFTEKGED